MRHKSAKLALILPTILLAVSYDLAADPNQASLSHTTDPNCVTVDMQPMQPDEKQFMKWSPESSPLPLIKTENGMETQLFLGPQGTPPVLLRLQRNSEQSEYDTLQIDKNRNGRFDDNIAIKATITPRNGYTYHLFKTTLDVPATDPKTGKDIINPYPVDIWYNQKDSSEAFTMLRFHRNGWMMGRVVVGNARAVILLAEYATDGVFDRQDRWVMVSPNRLEDIYIVDSSHKMSDNIRVGQNIYRVVDIHPSGRRLTLQWTKTDIPDEVALDKDRDETSDRRRLFFAKDFAKAQSFAAQRKKRLLVYFTMKGCGFCKRMEKEVFTDDAVIAAAADIMAVRVELEKSPRIVKQFGVKGYPTFFLLSPDGMTLRKVVGYQNVAEMKAFLKPTPPQQDKSD